MKVEIGGLEVFDKFVTRTISGVALLLLLVLCSFGEISLLIFSIVVSLIGLFEIYVLEKIENNIYSYISYFFAVMYYIFLWKFQDKYTLHVLITYIIVLAIVYVLLYPKFEPQEIKNIIFGFIYVAFLFSFMYRIRTMENGVFIVWLVFFGAWGTDVCAYLSGMFFGNKKLAPVLSPKKSVEGAIGGVAGAMILTLIYMIFVINVYANQFDGTRFIVLLCSIFTVGVGSVLSQFGDLFASAFKRHYGVKDYGNLIPGHGGVLDRFDSVLFTAPVTFIFMSLL